MNTNNGGPAFPSCDEKGFTEQGMTLYEYYAAHAPAEIPGWFTPSTKIAQPKMPEPAPEIAEEAKEWLRDSCYDFSSCFNMSVNDISYLPGGLMPRLNTRWLFRHKPLAEKFEKEMSEYYDALKSIQKREIEIRYFAWRWYYAKMMVQKHGEE